MFQHAPSTHALLTMSFDSEEQGRKQSPDAPIQPSSKVARLQAEPEWRGDPHQTYSDWKLEIAHKRTTEDAAVTAAKVDVYHVHKVRLGCGNRKSDYFDRLFQNGEKFQEGSKSCSRIELEPLAAAAFPNLLDYCYDPSRELKISAATALPLHHLGDYFEIRQLREDVDKFIQADVSCQDGHHLYVEHAMIFGNDAVLERVAQSMADAKPRLGTNYNAKLSELFCPQLWLKLGTQIDQDNFWACQQQCFLLSLFMLHNFDRLEPASLHKLTNSEKLPVISSSSAVNFVSFMNSARENPKWKDVDFASLEGRCADVISSSRLSNLTPENKENAKSVLKEASQSFLFKTLIKTWEQE